MGYGPYEQPPRPYDNPPGGHGAPPSSGYGAPVGGGYQQPFGGYQPQGPYPPPPTGTNSMCVISLVAAIASWVICAGIGGLAAVIFGILGRKQARETGEQGEGIALAGIIVGGINVVVFGALFLLIFVIGLSNASG